MYGTNTILDSLAAFDAQTVLEYGEDRLLDVFQQSLDAHNRLVEDMLASIGVEFTNDRVRRYGVESRMQMIPADEFTRADAQKIELGGVDIGFPLRLWQISLQWTRKHLEVKTVREARAEMAAAQRADVTRVREQVQRALFTPTNNLTYVDRLVDGVTIPLRALLNADGAPIPDDDFGNSFDGSTHTHYLATASLDAAAVQALLDTVIEHGVTGQVRLYINRAQEATVAGLANFTPYTPPLIVPGPGSTEPQATGRTLQPFDIYNRPIGVWNGAVEVWVKSWVPANYLLAVEIDPANAVLAVRTRPGIAARGELRIVAEDERYPLRAQTMEREFGVGVWRRENAAVLYTGGATYQTPSFTA